MFALLDRHSHDHRLMYEHAYRHAVAGELDGNSLHGGCNPDEVQVIIIWAITVWAITPCTVVVIWTRCNHVGYNNLTIQVIAVQAIAIQAMTT